MPDVVIRVVEPQHPDAVALRRTMYDDLSVLYPEATATVEASGGFDWLDARRAGTWLDVLVADLDGRSVGHVGSRAAVLTGFPPGTVEEVRALVVDPSARRLGVGGGLLDALAVRARARGARLLVLETGARQDAALGLYRERGWRAIAAFAPHEPDPTSVFLALDL